MALRKLATQARALLQRGAAGGELSRASFSTLPEDLAAAAARARFPARRFQPAGGAGAAAEAAGVPPAAAAAAAQQAAAQQVQVGEPLLLNRAGCGGKVVLHQLPIVRAYNTCRSPPHDPHTHLPLAPRLAQPPHGCFPGSGGSCRAASSSGGRRCTGEWSWGEGRGRHERLAGRQDGMQWLRDGVSGLPLHARVGLHELASNGCRGALAAVALNGRCHQRYVSCSQNSCNEPRRGMPAANCCPHTCSPLAAGSSPCRGVFVVGIALILFNRIEWEKTPDPVRAFRLCLIDALMLLPCRG